MCDGPDGLEVSQKSGGELGDGRDGRSHLGAGLVKVRLVANTTDHHGERCSGRDLNGTKLRREEPLPPRLAKRRVGRLGAADFVQHAGGEIGRDRRVRQCGQQVVERFPLGLIGGVRSQPALQPGQLTISQVTLMCRLQQVIKLGLVHCRLSLKTKAAKKFCRAVIFFCHSPDFK